MDKMNVARLLVDTHPGNRLLGKIILPDTSDLRMRDGNVLVAAPADLDRRIIRVARSRCRPMAVGARDVQLVDMDMVVKCNRLGGARSTDPVGLSLMAGFRPKEGEAQKCQQSNTGNGGKSDK